MNGSNRRNWIDGSYMGIITAVQCEELPSKLDFSNPGNIDCKARSEKNHHRLANHFAEKRDDYFQSYWSKTIFCFSSALLTSNNRFHLLMHLLHQEMKREWLQRVDHLDVEGPFLAGFNLRNLKEPSLRAHSLKDSLSKGSITNLFN